MKVLIVEQNHFGHFYNNDRLVIDALCALGVEVVLAVTPEGLASDEFRVHLSDVASKIDVRPILKVSPGGILNGIRTAAGNLNLAVKETRPDVMYVVTAEGIAQAAGLARLAGLLKIPKSVYCECLIGRLNFTYPPSPTAERKRYPRRPFATALSLLALRRSPFATIHLIDVLAYEWMQRFGGKLARRMRIIPDPVEEFTPMSRAEACRLLGLPEEGRYLICPGLLDSRKGIPLLIEALEDSKLGPTDRLVLAGRATPEIAARLRSHPCVALREAGCLIVIDRVLSREEFAATLWAADVVLCTYPYQPWPTSIAVKALACGRPILGSDSAWLGKMIPRFNMGWTVNVFDHDALAAALGNSLDQSASWQVSEAGKRLIQFSSAENYKESWMASLRERMGLPQHENVPKWDWVVGGK